MTDRVLENLGFEFWKCHGEMGLRQVKQGFPSLFPQIYTIFDDFSKFSSTFGMLHYEKSSNMASIRQKLKNSHVDWHYTHFSADTRKMDFEYSFCTSFVNFDFDINIIVGNLKKKMKNWSLKIHYLHTYFSKLNTRKLSVIPILWWLYILFYFYPRANALAGLGIENNH